MNKLANGMFTDCYIAMSDNLRGDMVFFFEKVGNIGLRHKLPVAKPTPGGLYLLLKLVEVTKKNEKNNLQTKFEQGTQAESIKSHRAKVIHAKRPVKPTKRKREVDMTDTNKRVQMKRSSNYTNLNMKLGSIKKSSEQTFAAATVP